LLRAVADGSSGKDKINPAVNAIQTLVVRQMEKNEDSALTKYTAAFHGRPELSTSCE